MARYRNDLTGAVRSFSRWPGPGYTILPPAREPAPELVLAPDPAPKPRRRRKVDTEASHGPG